MNRRRHRNAILIWRQLGTVVQPGVDILLNRLAPQRGHDDANSWDLLLLIQILDKGLSGRDVRTGGFL